MKFLSNVCRFFNTLAPVSELPFFENTAQNQNQFKIKNNFMVFLTCAARSDCDIEPPFEFPNAPSPADWSGDPIRGGVDSFLRGTGLIGSLKNRMNFWKFRILSPYLGFILPAELSAMALTVSMRSGMVWHLFRGSKTSNCLTTDRNGACSGFDDGE